MLDWVAPVVSAIGGVHIAIAAIVGAVLFVFVAVHGFRQFVKTLK